MAKRAARRLPQLNTPLNVTISSTATAASPAAVAVSNELRPLLLSMLRSQAYRELAAVQLLEQALAFMPRQDHTRLRHQQDEERTHLEAALALWQQVAGESRETLLAVARARLAEKPMPAVRDALDVAMVQFVFDRAGYFVLREYVDGSCGPYARIAAAIVAEEEGHQDDGARTLVPLARAAPQAAQVAFEKWLRPSLLSFGRPGSEGDRQAVALGLKRRGAGPVMQDYVDSLRPCLSAAGLRLPTHAALGLSLQSLIL